jgi:hypothetical protein
LPIVCDQRFAQAALVASPASGRSKRSAIDHAPFAPHAERVGALRSNVGPRAARFFREASFREAIL